MPPSPVLRCALPRWFIPRSHAGRGSPVALSHQNAHLSPFSEHGSRFTWAFLCGKRCARYNALPADTYACRRQPATPCTTVTWRARATAADCSVMTWQPARAKAAAVVAHLPHGVAPARAVDAAAPVRITQTPRTTNPFHIFSYRQLMPALLAHPTPFVKRAAGRGRAGPGAFTLWSKHALDLHATITATAFATTHLPAAPLSSAFSLPKGRQAVFSNAAFERALVCLLGQTPSGHCACL